MNARRRICNLRHRIGRRGASLLTFGAGDIGYGYWLAPFTPTTPSTTRDFFATLMPMTAWAIIWWIVAAVCILYAFRHDDENGFNAAIGIKLTWATFSVVGYLTDGVGLGSVAVWCVLATMVIIIAGWHEPEHGGSE